MCLPEQTIQVLKIMVLVGLVYCHKLQYDIIVPVIMIADIGCGGYGGEASVCGQPFGDRQFVRKSVKRGSAISAVTDHSRSLDYLLPSKLRLALQVGL